MASILSLSEVSFSYGAMAVLRGISLSVAPGEILCVVGPNGAGKSTLLRLMGGTLRPQSGSVSLGGTPLTAMKPRARARLIASVPQESRVPFSFRAMEVVLMGRAPHLPAFGFESGRDIAVAREAMRQTDCADLADRDINALSGGERQRVFLARALAQEPAVLLLDEPTTFLDIRHQIDLHHLLRRLCNERGMAIAAAMHDLNLAAAVADRIALLKDGVVSSIGSPAEVITAPRIRDVFRADVNIGTDPMSGRPYCLPPTSTP